jgi:hypothetical protein
MSVEKKSGIALIATVAIVAMGGMPAAAQSSSSSTESELPRTAWGAPDLGGVWDYRTITPLERPEEYGDRAFLTEEEVAELEQGAEDRELAADQAPARLAEAIEEDGNPLAVVGCCNRFWLDYGTQAQETRRTSLIIDPPNGRMPPKTPEGEKRPGNRSSFGSHAFETLDDFSAGDRCNGTLGVPIRPIPYNNNVQVFQTEDHVVMSVEMFKTTRIIPISDSPHGMIRQDVGDSRGHWDGDVFVVETTNFTDGPTAGGASQNATLIERFRRVSPEILEYEYTIDDPDTWTAPWSALQTLRHNPLQIYEYACHEGNYGLVNMLRGARLEELAAKKSGGQ